MKKHLVPMMISAALLLVLLCACGAGQSENDRRSANELVVGISQDLEDSLDLHRAVAAGTKELLFNVYEGLVKPNTDGELCPAVAQSWELSDDRRTYRFLLRPNVKFHNGANVTADDVAWSISDAKEAGMLPALENIGQVGWQDGEVTVTLREPDSDFLSYMTLAVMPKDYADAATAPCGTGPFRFVSRAAQQNLVLERFEDYWGEKAKLSRVTYQVYENAEALLMALRGGAVDLSAHMTATQVSQLSGFQILEGTMNLVQAVYLNHDYAPLQSLKVRQALCCALDRQAIFDIVADGRGSAVGSSMYPNFRKYFLPELSDAYPYDTERAKSLLAEAGYPNGFDLTVTVPSNYQPHMDTAQVVAEQLRAVGVNAVIEPVEWATWLSEVYTNRNYQATIVGVDATTLTARAMLERFTSAAGNNFINYANGEYDAAFDAAVSAADEAVQRESYLRCERILSETAANVYIQDLADLVALRDGLTGYRFYPIYVIDLSTVSYG